jgi:hypothetical protein
MVSDSTQQISKMNHIKKVNRCGHHFHQSCLKEWLTLNRRCPLCKQDFRGKEYEEDSGDDDEDDDEDVVIGGESFRNGNEFRMNQMNAAAYR